MMTMYLQEWDTWILMRMFARIMMISMFSSPTRKCIDRANDILLSGFSQKYQIGNFDIMANFVFPLICMPLYYLNHVMLVNVYLEINRYKRITFQGHKLYWRFSFVTVQVKGSWQYWHSCIVESLWKPPMSAKDEADVTLRAKTHMSSWRYITYWLVKWDHL